MTHATDLVGQRPTVVLEKPRVKNGEVLREKERERERARDQEERRFCDEA